MYPIERCVLLPYVKGLSKFLCNFSFYLKFQLECTYNCSSRYLLTLKQYVRNRAHPEGSIAKGYLMEECMSFCARYLDDVETKSNRPLRNYDGGEALGRSVGESLQIHLDNVTWTQTHRYVLFNTDSVKPFLK